MSFRDKELERLLQIEQDKQSGLGILEENGPRIGERQQAEKSADLSDFIGMVAKIVSVALKDENVEFVPDEGKKLIFDPTKPIDHPYITFKVISRRPKDERKPRYRQAIDETGEDAPKNGHVYGQRFECIVQFNIIASEYTQADKVMNTFEELMFQYTHYFKKNGVAELLFEKHFTDENYDTFREKVSVRNLQYYVEIEKLITVFNTTIDSVEIN